VVVQAFYFVDGGVFAVADFVEDFVEFEGHVYCEINYIRVVCDYRS
jgi:hypothetical protein